MMHPATLLLLTGTLVLRSGDRIAVEGPLTERNGAVIFCSGGALYSMPLLELDLDATRAANKLTETQTPPAPRSLKVSRAERERLLRELEQNHSGKPATEQTWQAEPLREPSRREVADQSAEEWRWRREARAYEESARQAKENLDLLLNRADRLRDEIRGLLSLGWKPQNFTYQTTQLASVEEQIPGAQLTVQRAERAYAEFREDARRQGILPGWLR